MKVAHGRSPIRYLTEWRLNLASGLPIVAIARDRYWSDVRHLPTILLVLSFPAGAIAYTLTVQVLTALLPASNDILILIAALFVAGLVMLPLLIPFFDRRAKRDLAAYRSEHPDGPLETPAPVHDEKESE